jgi:hypothetical protein
MTRWLSFKRAAPRSQGRGAVTALAGATHEAPAVPAATGAPAGRPTPPADLSAHLLAWWLDTPPAGDAAPPRSAEADAIGHLDTLIGGGELPPGLLSRAPAVIPQLLRLLRQDDASVVAMAQRVSADPMLTAEVLRLASSAFYRTRAAVTGIEHAIAMLGRNGLHMAIASVVLKPLFDAPSGSLSRRAAPRLWEHSTVKARRCAVLAAEQGHDGFEGYLAGLLHNTGWTVLLRALDGCEGVAPPFDAAFARRLGRRADRLFAKAVGVWHITPPLTALCDEMLRARPEGPPSPLAAALLQADRAATLELLGPPTG